MHHPKLDDENRFGGKPAQPDEQLHGLGKIAQHVARTDLPLSQEM